MKRNIRRRKNLARSISRKKLREEKDKKIGQIIRKLTLNGINWEDIPDEEIILLTDEKINDIIAKQQLEKKIETFKRRRRIIKIISLTTILFILTLICWNIFKPESPTVKPDYTQLRAELATVKDGDMIKVKGWLYGHNWYMVDFIYSNGKIAMRNGNLYKEVYIDIDEDLVDIELIVKRGDKRWPAAVQEWKNPWPF